MVQLPDASDVGRASLQPLRTPALAAPRDSSGAALEAVGETVARAGETLQKAERRVRSGEDAVARARALSRLNAQATEQFLKFETEEDTTDPETLKRFGAFMQKAVDETLASHTGTEQSRNRLASSLAELQSSFTLKAASTANTQRRALLKDVRDNQFSTLMARAQQTPSEILELFKTGDAIVDDQAPALTPDEERDERLVGRKRIATAAVTSFLDRGTIEGLDAAEKLLAVPGVTEALGDEAVKIQSKVTVARAAEQKGIREANQQLARTATILKKSVDQLTPEERLRAGNLTPEAPKTLSGKIAELERVFGRPLTEEEVAEMAGVASADDPVFGKGLEGRALSLVTDDAGSFANNLLSEADERRFIAAAVQLQQPVQFLNPDTKVVETRRPALPPFVLEALRRRGREDLIEKTTTLDPLGDPESDQATAPLDVQAPDPAPSETIFGMSGDITGPVPAAGEFLSRTPLVGSFMQTPAFIQSRKRADLLQRNLVRVLQNNPRFAEGEREAIEREVSISGEIFDTPEAYRNRLIGIDDALALREQNAFETSRSPFVTSSERQQALNVLNALTKFRKNLGVPPIMKTPDEARRLPEGAPFRTPDGRVLFNRQAE